MKKLLLLFVLFHIGKSFAQQTPCVATTSYTLTYQSADGSGNCTFLFKPTVTVNQSGSSVKLARYTFTAGSTTVQVCYSGNPVAIVNCNGSFTALPGGASQAFPTATVVLPCNGTNTLVLTGSTSAQGASTCTSQTVTSGPLPVKLLSFYGTSNPEGITLNWATEWESTNEGFEVEKSTDAKAFEAIGFVKGQLTTNQVSSYEFVDASVTAGTAYYYRLKQLDVDGSAELSRIISVVYRPDQKRPISVFPNAAVGGNFMVSMPDAESATIKLYNQTGVELPVTITKTSNPNLVSIAAQVALPQGIYLLKVNAADETQQVGMKLVVE